MGSVVAALDKKGRDVSEAISDMLIELRHRGHSTYGIASSTRLFYAKNTQELKNTKLNTSVAIGHNYSRIFLHEKEQPLLTNNFAIVFDGRIYPFHGKSELEKVMEVLERLEDAYKLILELEGDFAFAITNGERIVAGRSVSGVCPLYYGENTQVAALASERKALWRIGIKKTISFPPGNVAVINKQGFYFHEIKKLQLPKTRENSIQCAVNNLSRLLFQAVEKRVRSLDEVAIAFSGGLDSGLIAFLTKKCEMKPTLIWVGLKNREELKHAEKAAEALNLPLETSTHDEEDVKTVLPKVLWLVEEPDPVKVGIAIPFYWTAEKASTLGFKVLLAGQGSDELFGGYQRYLTVYSNLGLSELEKTLFIDVVKAHETNYERDSKICTFHGVELRLPFTDYQLSEYTLGIATKLKINSAQDPIRKRVLRETAEEMGLPRFIAKKPKKAIQYATGVNKTLRGLARKKGLSLKEYIRETFERTCVTPYPIGRIEQDG